jgi:hypothetical protein
VNFNTFWVCSSESRVAHRQIQQKKGIVYVLRGKPTDVSMLSRHQGDSEFMFAPMTKFKIVHCGVASVATLAQANIRQTQGKMDDITLQKAMDGKICVMIELEQQS